MGPAYGSGVLGGCHEPLTPSTCPTSTPSSGRKAQKPWAQTWLNGADKPVLLSHPLHFQVHPCPVRAVGTHPSPKLTWHLVPVAPASSASRSLISDANSSWSGPPLLASTSSVYRYAKTKSSWKKLWFCFPSSSSPLPPPLSDFSECRELQTQFYSTVTHWNIALSLQGNQGLHP